MIEGLEDNFWKRVGKEMMTWQYNFFLKDDVRKIQTLHDDAVVVSTMIANYDVKKNLIYNESSTDVLFYLIFFWIQLPTDQLKKISMSLVGFTRDAIIVEEEITLPLTARVDLQ